MQIELTDKETTALSFLRVLKGKLTKSINNHEHLSTRDLRTMVDNGLSRINKEEMKLVDMYIAREDNNVRFNDSVVEDQVTKSNIKRLDWYYRKVLGMSISKFVKTNFCDKGISVEDAEKIILKSKETQEIIRLSEIAGWKKEKVLENLKISVHSRYTDDRNFGEAKGDGDEEI